LLVDNHRHGTSLDALTKRDAAPTGKPCVCEPLQHCAADHTSNEVSPQITSSENLRDLQGSLQQRLDFCFEGLFDGFLERLFRGFRWRQAHVLRANLAIPRNQHVDWYADNWSVRILHVVVTQSLQHRIVHLELVYEWP